MSTTLRNVLKENSFDYVPLMDLDLPLLSPEVSNTADVFCVGYFIDGTTPEIHLVLFDRKKLQWFESKVNLRESEYCFGSNAITGNILKTSFTWKLISIPQPVVL